MQNVRPVLPGAEKLFDVEKLDICGPLTTELSSHFASLYGERFTFYPRLIDHPSRALATPLSHP